MSFDLLPFDPTHTDHDLTARVRLALVASQRSTLRSVMPEVTAGVVTLRGVLPTFFDRQVAFETARHVAGVHRVQDELEVRETSPAHERSSAPFVESQRSQYLEERTMPSRPLPVKAPSSRSTLWGSSVAVLSLLVLVLTGCSDGGPARLKVHPVSGRITLDSQPLPNAMIVLHPKDKSNPKHISSRAQTDAQGNFKVSTYDQGDGAPAGDYVVTVLFHRATETPDGVVPGPNLLSPQIASPDTSDIQVKVAEGQNELQPIEVRR